MAITTNDQRINAARQLVPLMKTGAVTTVAAIPFTLFDVAGNPGAGSLTIGNTANGLVPDDTVAGFPLINAFGGGNTGYLDTVEYSNSVACRLALYDRLFHVGSISLTALATTTLTAQPSFVSRLPGSSYVGLEIWLEFTAAVSATATTVTVNYTNEAGVAGRTTGATATLSGYLTRRMLQLPLQAGDKGVQKIESVIVGGTVATTGLVNVIIARRLWRNRVPVANGGGVDSGALTPNRIIYENSALWPIVWADSTASGIPDITAHVING